ncbi:MAG: right-handed parallel beta-helix repeat-containing protein [Opitutales bacterium]
MSPDAPRTYVVNQQHPQADDQGVGTADAPFRTINAAAALAGPGDTVVVHAGVYRERVNPQQGGEAGAPVAYRAAVGEAVFIRGSDLFAPTWASVDGAPGVFTGSLSGVTFGTGAYAGHCDPKVYGDFNPFLRHFNRNQLARPHADVVADAKARLDEAQQAMAEVDEGADIVFGKAQTSLKRAQAEYDDVAGDDPRYRRTLGQVFCDGRQLTEVERVSELHHTPASWMASPAGDELRVHFPDGSPENHTVEISTRHTCFAPLQRGLGYITLEGFTIEHGANCFITWGTGNWPQAGLVSCRSGHHWTIRRNTIRFAKSGAIDCGREGGGGSLGLNGENPGFLYDTDIPHKEQKDNDPIPKDATGWHLIENNHICDNGHYGICGIVHTGTRVLGNLIERNNYLAFPSPYWEFGGIKFHFFFDGVIEGNLIRDNDAHGIWLDNQYRGSRVTRNVIISNLWSGVNVELGRGPVQVDNNIIAYTRHGSGVYGHDASDVLIAHNLIYANASCGVWFAYCTPRVKPEDGCWQIRVLNNMILGNNRGAVGLPLPWACAGDNESEGNLLMGHGEYLDEGSGPFPPHFVYTNRSHVGQMPRFMKDQGVEAQTPDVVVRKFTEALKAAGIPESEWPNLEQFQENYFVPHKLWTATMGMDRESRSISIIKDMAGARTLVWDFDMPETVREVTCKPVDGVDKDFHGNAMDSGNQLLPGPWQDLPEGHLRIPLWPVRGVPTDWWGC